MRASAYLVCLVIACGNDTDKLGSSGTPDAPSLALGALMPQEQLGSASAVIAMPTVVPISYQGDPNGSNVLAFYPQLAASPAWGDETSEYGICGLAVGEPQQLPVPVASSDTDIRTILTDNLGGASPAWGPANETTVYAFTLPVGTPFVSNLGATGFCGSYHDDFDIGSADVSYSIELPCSSGNPPALTPVQVLTAGLSSALVDSVTDPRFEHELGYAGVDSAHAVWNFATGGEVADLCALTDTAFWTDAPGMTFTIQRAWSNAAASAGTDPCVGSPLPSYDQSVPEQAGSATISVAGGDVATTATTIALGATGSLTVHVAGSPGDGPFTVSAIDVASDIFGATTPLLTFEQPTGTFAVGDTVTIAVTVGAKDASLGGAGAEAFAIQTTPVHGGPATFFYGLVGQ